jgi:iron complex transport system substrate-binding protein
MKRWLVWIAASFVATAHAAGAVDDAGHTLELAAPARRVVTLAPNLTELVYAVGAGATLVGTVDTSNFPPAAQAVQRVGDYQHLDVERILTLKPDLVLAWLSGNTNRELQQLEAAGLRLFYLEPRRLADIGQALRRVGTLLGHGEQAERRATALQRELADLQAVHTGASPVTVFFQVWSDPVMSLNDQHLVGEVIRLCGGRNVFGSLPQLVPQLSAESVLAADPEVMVSASDSSLPGAHWQRDPQHRAFVAWQRFPKLTAVRHGWLYVIPGDHISRQGPRIAEGVRAMCGALDEVRRERDGEPRRQVR